MFKINPTANRISPLEVKRFSDLGFTERKHLQEWLENYPQALTLGDGDDLLIIQKEFDGFDDTRERLDLRAVNKEGNLVIIDNKLEDRDRDGVGEAVIHVSYCAILEKHLWRQSIMLYLPNKAESKTAYPTNPERLLLS